MLLRNRGAECNIICTQPRRLAATGVASRVADERAEKIGVTIGYSIRLETVRSEETRLLFVTTGVLLRRLQSDPWLEGVSHLILDEVHERDLNSDFLLIILRELIKKRKDIKLILMSATLNADIFSKYFENCPVLDIPGRTFPVQEFYLEHAINQSDYTLSEHSPYARQGGKQQQPLAKKYPDFPPRVVKVLENMDSKKINYELIERLVVYICDKFQKDDGAILIFLPGLQEISTLLDLLQSSGDLRRKVGSASRLRLLPLHSSLSTEQQQQIFERPPAGVRKIILSTNIAETSITVDGTANASIQILICSEKPCSHSFPPSLDVVFVIDSCRVKEKKYDPVSKLESLEETWCSQAACRQRRGRYARMALLSFQSKVLCSYLELFLPYSSAGRVRAGLCWHLVTSQRMEKLEPFQLPEMRRVPLDELCLQIRLLKLGSIRYVSTTSSSSVAAIRSIHFLPAKILIFCVKLNVLAVLLCACTFRTVKWPLPARRPHWGDRTVPCPVLTSEILSSLYFETFDAVVILFLTVPLESLFLFASE
jgi:HrpA-like RNA helicase